MFKIASSETYSWPVTVSVPTDGGLLKAHTFTVQFKRIPQSRIEEIAAGPRGVSDREYAREFVAGWGSDVLDEQDVPVPFSVPALTQFLDIPGMATAIVLAYFESVTGAKRKN